MSVDLIKLALQRVG